MMMMSTPKKRKKEKRREEYFRVLVVFFHIPDLQHQHLQGLLDIPVLTTKLPCSLLNACFLLVLNKCLVCSFFSCFVSTMMMQVDDDDFGAMEIEQNKHLELSEQREEFVDREEDRFFKKMPRSDVRHISEKIFVAGKMIESIMMDPSDLAEKLALLTHVSQQLVTLPSAPHEPPKPIGYIITVREISKKDHRVYNSRKQTIERCAIAVKEAEAEEREKHSSTEKKGDDLQHV